MGQKEVLWEIRKHFLLNKNRTENLWDTFKAVLKGNFTAVHTMLEKWKAFKLIISAGTLRNQKKKSKLKPDLGEVR